MEANTDTRWFWKLSRNIYRFTPAVEAENVGQHTVNEVCRGYRVKRD